MSRKAVAVFAFLSIVVVSQLVSEVQAGAAVEAGERWPSRTIRYAICDCANGDPKPLCSRVQCLAKDTAATARKAIDAWNTTAGDVIKLMPRDPADDKSPYILLMSQESSTSKSKLDPKDRCATQGVGWSGSNDAKVILIPDGCVLRRNERNLMGVIQHEIGHAVGLHHEQQRTDRDKYILVKFTGSTANSAISQSGRMCASEEQEKCEFQSFLITRLYTYGQDVGEYDFGSVMHYALYPRDPNKWEETCGKGQEEDLETACIGLKNDGIERLKAQQLDMGSIADRQRGLSPLDVEALRTLYRGVPE